MTWFSLLLLIFLLPVGIAAVSMAPWVPTRKKDIERLLGILELQPGENFLEIGCGDGRVSWAIAKKFPEAHVQGIEMAFPIFFLALMRKYILWVNNMSVRLADAFKEDFWSYDAIYVYGMPDKMWAKIIPQFMDQAKEWAKLYSYVFSIPEEYSDKTISHGWEWEAKIHVLER